MRERCWYLTEVVVAWSLEKALWCFDKKTLIEKEREKTNIDSASVSQSVLWTRYGKKKLSAVCWTWVWEASVNWFFFLWFRHWGENQQVDVEEAKIVIRKMASHSFPVASFFSLPRTRQQKTFVVVCVREREREKEREEEPISPLFHFSFLVWRKEIELCTHSDHNYHVHKNQ